MDAVSRWICCIKAVRQGQQNLTALRLFTRDEVCRLLKAAGLWGPGQRPIHRELPALVYNVLTSNPNVAINPMLPKKWQRVPKALRVLHQQPKKAPYKVYFLSLLEGRVDF
jgi:hypothetical protein